VSGAAPTAASTERSAPLPGPGQAVGRARLLMPVQNEVDFDRLIDLAEELIADPLRQVAGYDLLNLTLDALEERAIAEYRRRSGT
jgi:hypothetical protein